MQLEGFGFFHEKIDAAGRLAAGPSRRLPAGTGFPVERRAVTAPPAASCRAAVGGLLVAILAMVVLIGVVAYPRLAGPGHASLELDTVPKGVAIEIDGRSAGTATDGKLVVDGLEIGRAYPVVARLDGYDSREIVVEPHKGSNAVSLELNAQKATVSIDSTPTGASVAADGKPRGTTPLVLTMTPSSTVELTFTDRLSRRQRAPRGPGPGKDRKIVQPLAVSDDLARVDHVGAAGRARDAERATARRHRRRASSSSGRPIAALRAHARRATCPPSSRRSRPRTAPI